MSLTIEESIAFVTLKGSLSLDHIVLVTRLVLTDGLEHSRPAAGETPLVGTGRAIEVEIRDGFAVSLVDFVPAWVEDHLCEGWCRES